MAAPWATPEMSEAELQAWLRRNPGPQPSFLPTDYMPGGPAERHFARGGPGMADRTGLPPVPAPPAPEQLAVAPRAVADPAPPPALVERMTQPAPAAAPAQPPAAPPRSAADRWGLGGDRAVEHYFGPQVAYRDAGGVVREARNAADFTDADLQRWTDRRAFEQARQDLGGSMAGSWELNPRNAGAAAGFRAGVARDAMDAVNAQTQRQLGRDQLAQQASEGRLDRQAQADRQAAQLGAQERMAGAEQQARTAAEVLRAGSGDAPASLLSIRGLLAEGSRLGAPQPSPAPAAQAAATPTPSGGGPPGAGDPLRQLAALLPQMQQAFREGGGGLDRAIDLYAGANLSPESKAMLVERMRAGEVNGDPLGLVDQLAQRVGTNRQLEYALDLPPSDNTGIKFIRQSEGLGGLAMSAAGSLIGQYPDPAEAVGANAIQLPDGRVVPWDRSSLPSGWNNLIGTGDRGAYERAKPRMPAMSELLRLLIEAQGRRQ